MQVTATSMSGGTGSFSSALNPAEQKEMFLRLLVTQLQNQDPMNPVNNEDFLSQMAQFTSVEQQLAMVERLDYMATEAAMNRSVAMIGREVDYLNGDEIVGGATVAAVSFQGGQPRLVLEDGTQISPGQVVRVQ